MSLWFWFIIGLAGGEFMLLATFLLLSIMADEAEVDAMFDDYMEDD